jgi:hypothetical protein
MSEQCSHNSETKDIVWDPAYPRELGALIEKRIGYSVSPKSIALVLGTGAFLFFCQAFLRRLTERFGEDSANYLADRIRELASRTEELQPNRKFLSDRQRNGTRNSLSRLTTEDRSLVPLRGAARTVNPAAEPDSFIYRIVVISISRFAGRRKF